MSRAHELAGTVREWAPHSDFRDARRRGFAALDELEQLAADAVAANERIRILADLFDVPDGGRYWRDWLALAERIRAADEAAA